MNTTTNPHRLCASSLRDLPGNVRRPSYDRAALKPSILHIGAGAFHRCHQAEYAEDLLEVGAIDCAIHVVNLRPPDLATLIGEQDDLYCRELRKGDWMDRRIIGSILSDSTVSDAASDPNRLSLERALLRACDPDIALISCTVTEKGYCHIPTTGELDLDHSDIVHDIAHPNQPDSLPGFLLEVARRRLDKGVALPVMMSCDNVPGNGATLARCVLSLAEHSAPEIAETLARDAVFLNTMVDRIVPATRQEDLADFTASTGMVDAGLVVGEPFRMWVVEDRARDRLPDLGRVGVIFTDRVHDFETLKMRVVNGIQSNMCQLGFLAGFEFMADVMADPLMSEFARTAVEQEVTPFLPDVPGIDIPDYVSETRDRLTNPSLRHRCVQISTDGSRKIRQRLIEPILDAHAAGQPTPCLLLGLAGWLQYGSGRSLDGAHHHVSDPLADRLAAMALETGDDPRAYTRAVVGLESVFPSRFSRNDVLVNALADAVVALREHGVAEAVKLALQA